MAEQEAIYFRDVFPVRRYIRRHYTKIRGILWANCNHCQKQIRMQPSFFLLSHLVQEHLNELTEEEKKYELIHWVWDHFKKKDTQNATCNICGSELKYDTRLDSLYRHLKNTHGILPPYIDDMDNVSRDANTNTTIRKDQIHSATSSKYMEQTGVLDK
ncbi:hypothetical protein ALC57_00643 [Trachymyrmex cornetzi]|uniref:BED-type domain-containing protein n=1 Tax=Trachymyrmex cornetzi TaxID=471704 RepID=A0A151JR76_9HYME|nr:hypothetical protein ALC57_00643 [Trachymyrmex cornetzi]